MAPKYRLFRWLTRGTLQHPEHQSADGIDKALARDSTVVSGQDVDTARQWSLLRARIEQQARTPARLRSAELPAWVKPAIAAAFAMVAICIGVGLFWFQPSHPVLYQTGAAQVSTVFLADSSEVTLNHNSKLVVDRQGVRGDRHSTLDGEAFFRVRKTGSPFVVTTALGSVEVLGTEFNVRMHRGEMEVAVVSGKVRVTGSRDERDSTVLLRVGEFTVLAKGRYPASPQRLSFSEDYPGWVHGKFLFDHRALASACSEIAERFGVRVELANVQLAGETITGTLDGSNVESAVKALSLLSGVSYRHEDSGYILY